MGRIALIPEGLENVSDYLDDLGVPDNYMEDYSVLGIVVDRYQQSLELLTNADFTVERLRVGALVGLGDPGALGRLLKLLQTHHIRCNYKDIAEPFYQS